jgi:polysaccharide export outer membrane protein
MNRINTLAGIKVPTMRTDLRSAPARLFAALAPMALAGCSIIPGLNVSERPPLTDKEDYQVTKEPNGDRTYRVERTDVAAGYRLIDLNVASVHDLLPPPVVDVSQSLGSVTPATTPPEYRVGPGDILTIVVWDHPELTNPAGATGGNVSDSSGQVVNAAGELYYPYVGTVQVSGLTVAEIRDKLAESLKRVIQSPQIGIRVITYRSKRVQVTGAVINPGIITLDDTSKGILEALSERGGPSELASRRRVLLTRNGATYEINYGALISGEAPAANPPLMPGDIVHIPDQSGDQIYVLGEVEKQGAVPLNQSRTTLTAVLAASSGLDKTRANDSGVLIFRRPDKDGDLPKVYRLDMSTPVGLLVAGEFELVPRDVVYIKATGFAKYNAIINQILPTVSTWYQLDRLINNN